MLLIVHDAFDYFLKSEIINHPQTYGYVPLNALSDVKMCFTYLYFEHVL